MHISETHELLLSFLPHHVIFSVLYKKEKYIFFIYFKSHMSLRQLKCKELGAASLPTPLP